MSYVRRGPSPQLTPRVVASLLHRHAPRRLASGGELGLGVGVPVGKVTRPGRSRVEPSRPESGPPSVRAIAVRSVTAGQPAFRPAARRAGATVTGTVTFIGVDAGR